MGDFARKMSELSEDAWNESDPSWERSIESELAEVRLEVERLKASMIPAASGQRKFERKPKAQGEQQQSPQQRLPQRQPRQPRQQGKPERQPRRERAPVPERRPPRQPRPPPIPRRFIVYPLFFSQRELLLTPVVMRILLIWIGTEAVNACL